MARYVGGYTRFYVEGSLNEAGQSRNGQTVGPRRYRDEKREWFQRWLVGRSVSRVLTVKVSLSRPDFSVTTTLASASHQSNRSDGESWTTEVNGQRVLTPFFRVDPNTKVSVETDLKASAGIQGQVTGAIIGVLQKAVGLAAPGSSLVTSLNSDKLNEASTFIDQSISALFGETLAEKSTNDFGPREWNDRALATIDAFFPMARSLADDRNARHVGSWTVRIERPVISIFGNVPFCTADATPSTCGTITQAKLAYAALAPSTVMNFPIAENVTIGQAVRTDTGITTALEALRRAAPATAAGAAAATPQATAARAEAARTVCALVSAKAESLGFNRFDAAAAVWAVANSDLVTSDEARLLLATATSCQAASLWDQIKPA